MIVGAYYTNSKDRTTIRRTPAPYLTPNHSESQNWVEIQDTAEESSFASAFEKW